MSATTDGITADILRRLDDLEAVTSSLVDDVRGNGDKGLKQRTARIESHVYNNPITGQPGLVQAVEGMREELLRYNAALRTLNWLIGTAGAAALLSFLRWILGS